jgi:hypothetical protein
VHVSSNTVPLHLYESDFEIAAPVAFDVHSKVRVFMHVSPAAFSHAPQAAYFGTYVSFGGVGVGVGAAPHGSSSTLGIDLHL